MKKSRVVLLAVVLLLIAFVFSIWFQSQRILPSPKLHEALTQKIQALTSGTLKYQGVRIGYLPQPRIIFEKPQLVFSDRPLAVGAEEIQFDFNILPLLLGHAEPSAFYVRSGNVSIPLPFLPSLGPVKLENFSLQVGAFLAKVPVPFHLSSEMGGKPGVFVAKGNFVLDSVEQWNWEKLSGSMLVELKQLSLHRVVPGPVPDRNMFFREGQVDTVIEIKKQAEEAFLQLSATGSGKGLAYEVFREKTWIAPPALDAAWELSAGWNNDTSEWKLHKGILKLPFGTVETNGSMKCNTGEIAGFHVTGSNMALEDLLKYWPGVGDAIPFHMGFSGPGKWALSLEGTLDHLSIHFDCELAQVLLSYGQYFSKPKDLPLDLNFDLLLQNSTVLGGDFALKFRELSMKGNLKDLDLRTGQGQLNMITNKFSMTGWEQYVPLLQQYKLEGDAKLMANWKGDLRRLEKAEHIFNLSFDKASWTVPEGPGLRNISLSLDYSPLMLEGRQMSFELGGCPILADVKISGSPQRIQATAKITSENFKPMDVMEASAALFHHKKNDAAPDAYDQAKDFLQTVFSKDRALEQLSAEVHYDGGMWDLASLQFNSYGGKTDVKGTFNARESKVEYRLEGSCQGVDLGLALGRNDPAQKVMQGALDLKGFVEGTGWGPEAWGQTLKGQGEFTLARGKFLTFDIGKFLAGIEPFKEIGTFAPDLQSFDSMNFQWRIADGKLASDNLLVKATDYVLDGEGTLGFDGLANYRMDVFLSSPLAAKLLPALAEPFEKNPQAHLGPVPALLSGPLTAPDLKPEPEQTADLVARIGKGKTKDFLCELVLE